MEADAAENALVKICPACNEKNPISEVICRVCMTNLASVSPVKAGAAELEESKKTNKTDGGPLTFRADFSSAPAVLTLSRLSDGRVLPAADGWVLGRSGHTLTFFEKDRTVSRRHAKIYFKDGIWNIEDLGSTNGTWVNGERLDPGKPFPVCVGDSIALSLACELKVIA